MTRTTVLRMFLAGAPLAFAALLMLHPLGEGTLYDSVAADTTPWLLVHFGAAALFPTMAWVVWQMIRGIPGRAAAIARVALPVFAVGYGVFEAVFGIASGIIAQEGNAADGAGRQALADTVNRIATHPVVGEFGVFNSIGAVAWIVAVSAALIALKGVGVRRGALVLLGIGTLMVQHVPPIGPVALVCLSAASVLIERRHIPRVSRRMALAAQAL